MRRTDSADTLPAAPLILCADAAAEAASPRSTLAINACTSGPIAPSNLLSAFAASFRFPRHRRCSVSRSTGGAVSTTVAGAATASVTPLLASRYSWEVAFTVAAGVAFVCVFPWFLVNPNRRIHA